MKKAVLVGVVKTRRCQVDKAISSLAGSLPCIVAQFCVTCMPSMFAGVAR